MSPFGIESNRIELVRRTSKKAPKEVSHHQAIGSVEASGREGISVSAAGTGPRRADQPFPIARNPLEAR